MRANGSCILAAVGEISVATRELQMRVSLVILLLMKEQSHVTAKSRAENLEEAKPGCSLCFMQVQSFDQTFDKMNKALLVSCQKGLPVRVVRSFKVN